jgi:signal transduction histidine kinase
VLQQRLPDEWKAEHRFLADLRQRAETCRELIDVVRDFACSLPMAQDSVDLADVVEKSTRQIAFRYPKLTVRSWPAPATFVRGDFNRLVQLASCLLIHSCEAAERGVETGLRRHPELGQVEWTVRDDGAKLLPERLERIFSPCYETRRGRLGTGMALARKIARMHGGDALARNGVEKGFEICVRLPIDVSSDVLAGV